ncbi:filamentous hemagglutinin N-terminal domain-containing protein [Celeribacter sp. SCSIO 80788]|uniref:two-partner secretion domain-containing protein n=1 Tax=Celeribacter sp. SCSIO 80788 TaxID=3117013 RepID=UPI003DA683D7
MMSLSKRSQARIRKTFHGFVTLVSSAAIVVSSVSASFAQNIIVDPSAPGTSFLQTSNGTPQIDIATPQSGVSLNQFSDLNVGVDGLILNNSTSNGVSIIGQNVTANPNLMVSGPANTIVAEITGGSPSTMTGTAEVFGKKAAVIVANPNGIVCNGCAFLNTSSSTLTTGRPIVSGSRVDLSVTEGTVTIGPDGFQPGTQGGIIGRHVILTGPVVASGQEAGNDLLVSGGAQRVQGLNGADLSASPIVAAPSTTAKTSPFAIDASEGGSLTGGDVIVRNPETGQGVNLYGFTDGRSLNAASGGNLFYKDIKVDTSASLAGAELRQYGGITAGGDVTINGRAFTLYDGRVIETAGDIEITGEEFVVIAGEVSGNNVIVDVATGTLTNTGFLMADGDLTVVAGEDVRQQREIAGEYDTALDPALQQYIQAYYAQLAAGGAEADIAAEMIARASRHELVAEYIAQGATATGTNVSITSEGGSILNEGGAIAGTRDVRLDAAVDVINRSLALLSDSACSGEECSMRTDFHTAEILSGGALWIGAGNDILNEASDMAAAGHLVLEAGRDIINSVATSKVTSTTPIDFGSVFGSDTGYVLSQVEVISQPGRIVSLLGDVDLLAGRNVELYGSLLSAGGTLSVSADNNADIISLTTDETGEVRFDQSQQKKNIFSANVISCMEDRVAFEIFCSPILSHIPDVTEAASTVSATLSGQNVYVSAGKDIGLAAARIFAEDQLSLVALQGGIRVLDTEMPAYLDRNDDRRPDLVEITSEIAEGLFGANVSGEEAEIAANYLAFLKQNELLTAVEALRRAGSGANIKDSARAVGAQSFISLIDGDGTEEANAARTPLETIWETQGAALEANQTAMFDLHHEFRTELAVLEAGLNAPPQDLQHLLDAALVQANADYDNSVAAAEAEYQAQLQENEDKYGLDHLSGFKLIEAKLRNYAQLKKQADAQALAERNSTVNAAATQLQLSTLEATAAFAEVDFEAEIASLKQAFEADSTQLQTERANLTLELNQALSDGLRVAEAALQAQVELAELRGLAVAQGSLDAGEASLASALTSQEFSGLSSANTANILSTLSDDTAERDAFLAAAARHFSTGGNTANLVSSQLPWTQLVANGDGLSLASATELHLQDAFLATDGQLTLSTLGDLSLFSSELSSNLLGGATSLTAGGNVTTRGTSVRTAGKLTITSGLGDVDIGATARAYDRTTGFDNVVGTLSDGSWNTNHHLLSQELSTLDVGGDLTIHAGAGLDIEGLSDDAFALLTSGNLILGGVVGTVGGNATLTSNRDMGFIAPRSEVAYSTGNSRNGTDVLDIQPHVTDLTVAGDFEAFAGDNMILEGTMIEADGTLSLSATNDLMLSAAQEVYQYNSRSYSKNWFRKKRSSREILTVTHDGSDLTSGAQMDIESQEGNVITAGSSLISEAGDINLSATQGDILVGAFTDVHRDQRRSSRSYLFGLLSSSSSNFREYATNTGSSLLAGLDLNVVSGGNTELVGAQLAAGNNLNFNVGGDLHVRAAIDSAREESFSSNVGLILATTETERSHRETAVLTALNANGDISFSVGGNTYLTLYSSPEEASASVAELYPEELEALAGLVLLDQELLDEYFYDETKALSPAFTMVLTIALTSGFGNLLTSARVTGLTVTNTTTGVTTLTHAGRAVASMAASTTVGIANGTVSGELDLGDILKNAAVSAGTSYLTSSINLKATGQTQAEWAEAQGNAAFAAVDDLGTRTLLGSAWDPSLTASVFGSNLTVANLLEGAFDASLSAGIQTAAYGGDFADAFRGSFINSVVALGLADAQTGIGGIFNDEYGNPINGGEGSLGHVLLHGLAGCAAAEAQGADCAAGAAGGIAQASFSGTDAVQGLTDEQQLQYAAILGAAVAFIFSGGDPSNVSVGSSVAQSGMANNRQLHRSEAELIRENAQFFAEQQGITEEEAKAILTAEALRGVSDDFRNIEKNETARTFLDNLALNHASAFPADQTLFGDLSGGSSSEYQNSLINIGNVIEVADLYGLVDIGGGNNTLAMVFSRAALEVPQYYGEADRQDILDLLTGMMALVEIFSLTADEIIADKENPDYGDIRNAEFLAGELRAEATRLAELTSTVAVYGSGHFSFFEMLGGGGEEVENLAQAYAQGLASMAGGLEGAVGIALVRAIKYRATATNTGRAIEFDGQFYSADGFKFSKSYYEYLYNNGRPAPFLQAREVLNSKPTVMPDPQGAAGYFRYEGAGLEMIYNPTTGQVGHIQPLR